MKHVFFAGPLIGYKFAWLNFDFAPEVSRDDCFVAGLRFRYAPHFLHHRWNLLLEAATCRQEFYGVFTETRNTGVEVGYTISLSYQMIRVPLKLEYSIPFKRVETAFSMGYDNIFLVDARYSMESNYQLQTDLYPYNWGLIFGGGMKFGITDRAKLILQAEYEFQSTFKKLGAAVDINCYNIHSLWIGGGIEFMLY
jgi:hypothetical protein